MLSFFCAVAALGCGPNFPNTYLFWGSNYGLGPSSYEQFWNELELLFEAGPVVRDTDYRNHAWERTLAADLADLRRALVRGGHLPSEVVALLKRYEELRRAMKQHADGSQLPGQFGTVTNRSAFDLEPYRPLLRLLPEEFALYQEGAVAYRAGRYHEAEQQWRRLLDLPAGKRHYRTTWAWFMLGKVALVVDPAHAAQAFLRVRECAAEGFADSAGLATSSLGWEAGGRLDDLRDPTPYALYRQQFREGNWDERESVVSSLDGVCREAVQNGRTGDTRPPLIHDDLARQIMGAWLMTRGVGGGYAFANYLAALRAAGLKRPLPGIGRIAWAAYERGEIEVAEECLGLADPAVPAARWVQARLLLR